MPRRIDANAARVAALCLIGGCYSGTERPGSDDATTSSGGESASEDASEDTGADAEPCAADEVVVPMRRLTHIEYARSIEALLGVDASPVIAEFPVEAEIEGFRNQADAQTLTFEHARQYQSAAEELVATAFADPQRLQQIVPCDTAQGEACLRTFVEAWTMRAFRRPLAAAEIDTLVALGSDLADPDDATSSFAIVAETVLQSPNFLFRVERGTPSEDDPGLLVLDGPSIAARMSFLLLLRPPDPWLLDAALAGELDDAQGRTAIAIDLLADPDSAAARASFAEQWLQLSRISGAAVSPELYPEYSEQLATSARSELEWLARRALRSGGDVRTLLTTREGWVDAGLAAIYGVPAPTNGFATVSFAPDTQRGGLFGTVGFALATTAYLETSVVQRGLFVRRNVMCFEIPDPPPDVDTSPRPGEAPLDASDRRLEDPACASCHQPIDLVGRGLEMYDPIGRLRDQYADGTALPGDGQLVDTSTPFSGGAELADVIAAEGSLPDCVAQKLFRFAMARPDAASDECVIAAITTALEEADGDFDAAMLAVVAQPAFGQRRVEETE
jgi:hypothetical protein